MPQVQIPQSLFDQIVTVVPTAASLDEFVVQAVQEKLSSEGRKREFFRLSNETREAMNAKGMSESDMLADFEAHRRSTTGYDRG